MKQDIVGLICFTVIVLSFVGYGYVDKWVKGQACSKLEKASEIALCLNGVK